MFNVVLDFGTITHPDPEKSSPTLSVGEVVEHIVLNGPYVTTLVFVVVRVVSVDGVPWFSNAQTSSSTFHTQPGKLM